MTIDSKEEEAAFLNLINGKGEAFKIYSKVTVASESFFLISEFEYKIGKEFWTSGTDLADEGKFFYLSSGKDVGQLNWSKDEPNNARRAESNETENCMAYTMTDNLKFYRLFDRFCSQKFYFVCQDI